jgi:hypothetical protein
VIQRLNKSPLHLRVVTEAEAGALVRVLHPFQARDIVPLQVIAQRAGPDFVLIEIEVDAADLTSLAFDLIIAKVAALPVVLLARACE